MEQEGNSAETSVTSSDCGEGKSPRWLYVSLLFRHTLVHFEDNHVDIHATVHNTGICRIFKSRLNTRVKLADRACASASTSLCCDASCLEAYLNPTH